jgi:SNF2 family DNA or RNA helicase
MPAIKVLIICPVSLQQEWKRTAEAATGLTVSSKPASWLESNDDSEEEDDSHVFIASWGKVPARINAAEQYVIVADEAHAMQSLEAARTKLTLSLTKAKGCIGVLLLTGTPMKNGKPLNLFPLLKAVQHPLGRHPRAYETHFCAGREIRYGAHKVVWNASGSSNVEQLRALSQSHLLHLTKEDCLKDLPPRTRIFQQVPVSSRRQMQHDHALQDLSRIHSSKSKSDDAILGAIQRLRMVGSQSKMDAAVQLAISVLEKEPAVVIFTSFVQVAKTVHQQLGESGWHGELLTGETPSKKRQAMVDRFQAGLSPVFVCTFGAGGVGLTLTAAHTIILIDRPWTPGEAHQAEDRVRRIGQTKPVRSIWMSAFGVDEQIDRLLEEKTQTTNSVLTGNNSSNEPGVQRSIVSMILEAVLADRGSSLKQQQLKTFIS